jgi:hypothetical protein
VAEKPKIDLSEVPTDDLVQAIKERTDTMVILTETMLRQGEYDVDFRYWGSLSSATGMCERFKMHVQMGVIGQCLPIALVQNENGEGQEDADEDDDEGDEDEGP